MIILKRREKNINRCWKHWVIAGGAKRHTVSNYWPIFTLTRRWKGSFIRRDLTNIILTKRSNLISPRMGQSDLMRPWYDQWERHNFIDIILLSGYLTWLYVPKSNQAIPRPWDIQQNQPSPFKDVKIMKDPPPKKKRPGGRREMALLYIKTQET